MTDSASPDLQPVFPQFLMGGPARMRLSRASLALLAGYGLTLQAVFQNLLIGPTGDGWLVQSVQGAIIILGAVLVAGVAARWLTEPLGVAAGVFQLSSLHTLGWPVETRPAGPLITLLVTIAIGVFAAANVPGRLRSFVRWRAVALFYGCGAGPLLLLCGWEPFAVIPVICLAYLLINQDGRAFRFLVHPLGLGALAVYVACTIWLKETAASPMVADILRYLAADARPALPMPSACWRLLATVTVAMFPWWPLAVVAVAVGCRQGHYARAFWQLIVCWFLSPLALAALGAIGESSALAMAAAPLSILAAAGFHQTFLWLHRLVDRAQVKRKDPQDQSDQQ